MAMNTGAGNGLRADMNVTPMIDVLLVLIIIFLMITPLAPKGEEALIPQSDPNRVNIPPPDATIVVQLLPAAKGERPLLKINQRDVSWEELESTLREIFIRRAEKVAFVKADRELNFEDVAQVIGIAHEAGVMKVGLMSEKKIG
ncbi:MAG: biopolymer transporter ExbD [Acidobacteriales bacterium]|nr:biopolymer transporter ExbD [Terriglobales bacterium]